MTLNKNNLKKQPINELGGFDEFEDLTFCDEKVYIDMYIKNIPPLTDKEFTKMMTPFR